MPGCRQYSRAGWEHPLTNCNPRQNTSSHEHSGKGVGLSGETSREGWTGEGEFKLGSRSQWKTDAVGVNGGHHRQGKARPTA